MTVHRVKSWPWLFQPIVDGTKTHDLRDMNDREYRVSDQMILEEFDPRGVGYTGRTALVEITYITDRNTPCAMSSTALAQNIAVLSIKLVPK